jgi:hypothetical protein
MERVGKREVPPNSKISSSFDHTALNFSTIEPYYHGALLRPCTVGCGAKAKTRKLSRKSCMRNWWKPPSTW